MSTILATQVRKHVKGPAKAAGRYWKGKAPKEAEVASDSDEDAEQQVPEQGDVPVDGEYDILDEEDEELHAKTISVKTSKINVALKDVSISRDGRVIVAGREESGRTIQEEESDEESVEDIAEEEEEEESSEDSESDDEKPKLMLRPVFVPKRGRVTIADRDAIVHEAEEMQRRNELAAEERKKESHDLVAESIRRELAEKEKEDLVPDVDDTDGLDPEGEFEAWRLRELGRIRKDQEEDLRREEEREEIERRRALPEEQRLKEDLERAKKSRDEKPKGKQKFLQKYWHKGAFHQDAEILKRHDFTEATESTVDASLLPKVMQVKNFGKRSRTKYTHLLDQDTTVGSGGFGGVGAVVAGGFSTERGGCFQCGGSHLKKDCPQNIGSPSTRGTAANTIPIGGVPDKDSWRDRNPQAGGRDHSSTEESKSRRLDGGHKVPPPRDSGTSQRSRSPFRDRRTSREAELDQDRYNDKRRRLD